MSFINKSSLNPVLSNRNAHIRDKNIKFFEEEHKYIITCDAESKYTSVTTWCHSHFPHFDANEVINNMMKGKNWKEGHKYWGLTAEQIKKQWNTNRDNVAGAGTDLHYEIECFNNDKRFSFTYSNKELYEIYMIDFKEKLDTMPIEWKYFLNFVRDNPTLTPYRTEWTVYNEDVKIAGSIDMIYENPDGTLSIYDWKRAKIITRINNFNKFAITPLICHFPDSNFWHYALQLNTYKVILEQKYGKVVKDLYLVRLHPDAEEKDYELIKLPDLSKEVSELFEERKRML
jgi:ATP-dependent exoDNAse (exonuclease V) beta subunit